MVKGVGKVVLQQACVTNRILDSLGKMRWVKPHPLPSTSFSPGVQVTIPKKGPTILDGCRSLYPARVPNSFFRAVGYNTLKDVLTPFPGCRSQYPGRQQREMIKSCVLRRT